MDPTTRKRVLTTGLWIFIVSTLLTVWVTETILILKTNNTTSQKTVKTQTLLEVMLSDGANPSSVPNGTAHDFTKHVDAIKHVFK